MNDDNKGTLMLTVVLVRSVKYGSMEGVETGKHK